MKPNVDISMQQGWPSQPLGKNNPEAGAAARSPIAALPTRSLMHPALCRRLSLGQSRSSLDSKVIFKDHPPWLTLRAAIHTRGYRLLHFPPMSDAQMSYGIMGLDYSQQNPTDTPPKPSTPVTVKSTKVPAFPSVNDCPSPLQMGSTCTYCNGLQYTPSSQKPDSTCRRWVTTTLAGLRYSTREGCRTCAVLEQGILLHHERFVSVEENDIRIRAESFDYPNANQHHLSVELRWKNHNTRTDGETDNDDDGEAEMEDHYPDLKLEFFTDLGVTSPFDAIGPGRTILDSPEQDGFSTTVRSLNNDCLEQHAICRRMKRATLPKRILDVSEIGDIRLHESGYDSNPKQIAQGDYTTLLHYETSTQDVLMTTSATLEAHKKSMPWSTLPKVFQDAVSVTRALGLRWLYIDSLCVLQDSECEKMNELRDMAEIYQNSYLTIAATSAAKPDNGLIFPKQPLFKIQVPDSQGSVSRIYVREQPSHGSFKSHDSEVPFNTSVEAKLQTPLLMRGCAYVKRLLSPRVLHFTKSEMILECGKAYQCECGRIDDDRFDDRTTYLVKQEFAFIARWDGHDETVVNNDHAAKLTAMNATSISDKFRDQALHLWSNIVTEYTARDFSQDEDRLVILAPIAISISKAMQSSYVAGQWTHSTLGLLWYPSDGDNCHRPKSTSVPSWSWASVEGKGSTIFFNNITAMDLACTASFILTDPGRNGKYLAAHQSAVLSLWTPLATEVLYSVDKNQQSLVKNGIIVDFQSDVLPQGDDLVLSGETLICVLVSMTYSSTILGLVLRRSKSDEKYYHRFGRFECSRCKKVDSGEMWDGESLFDHWFPEVDDMEAIDDRFKSVFLVI